MRTWMIMILVLVFLLAGCGKSGPDPQFSEGDIVIHKLSGNEGQVIEMYKGFERCWTYKVRFVVEQIVVNNSGDSIKQKTLLTEHMKEYELQAKGKR